MIKVDVVSGFLGSGKTTLIKKLLKEYENEKVILIENEFGEIGIDGDIIEREGFEVFEISSGCICCIMKKDFVDVLKRVIVEFNPERIVIEPTGLSILSEIIEVLNSEDLKKACSINSLITVIDAVNYLEQSEAFGEFFEDQIVNAEKLILSKTQMVDENTLKETIKSLKDFNPGAEIIVSPWKNLNSSELKELLSENFKGEFKDLFYTDFKPCSENQFQTMGIETTYRFTDDELNEILNKLKDEEYGEVLRAKGFLKGRGGYFEFSYTNGQYLLEEKLSKASGKLCVIGRNLEKEKIKVLFKAKSGGFLNWLKY